MKKINGRGKKSVAKKSVVAAIPVITGKVKPAAGKMARAEKTPVHEDTATSNGKSKGLTARLVRKAEQLQKDLENKLRHTTG